MTSRSRLSLAALTASAALVLGSALPAAAFGGETFGCRIAPGTVFTWSSFCTESSSASSYNVAFQIFGTTSDYTYSWSVSGPYTSVITGCTSTSVACAVSVPGGPSDKELTGTVTYTQNGQTGSQTAHAYVRARCGSQLC